MPTAQGKRRCSSFGTWTSPSSAETAAPACGASMGAQGSAETAALLEAHAKEWTKPGVVRSNFSLDSMVEAYSSTLGTKSTHHMRQERDGSSFNASGILDMETFVSHLEKVQLLQHVQDEGDESSYEKRNKRHRGAGWRGA
jgi:hypothetical protein